MKNYKDTIIKILGVLLIVPLYFIVGTKDLFLYVFSYFIYLIFINLFSHIDITNILKKYNDNNLSYSVKKIYLYSNYIIILINIFLVIISYILGITFENIFNIPRISIVFIAMSLTVFTIPCLNMLKELLEINNYKKTASKVLNLYYFFNMFFILIISIIIFGVFDMPSYISNSLLYLPHILSFILVYLLIYHYVIKRNNLITKNKIPTREEVKIKYLPIIKKAFSTNIEISIVNIIKYILIYLSIIFLYCTLMYKYFYEYKTISNIIVTTYFYAYRISYVLIIIAISLGKNKYEILINNLKIKNYSKFIIEFNKYFFKLLKFLIPACIICSFVSGPIWMLLFNNYDGSTILMLFSYIPLFLTIYIIVNKLLLEFANKKILYISLMVGLFFKIIFTIPLIESFSRMDYNLVYADIICSLISYLISIIISLIAINNKCQADFTNVFENILEIIYHNLFLYLLLMMLQLIVSIDVNTRLDAFIVIVVYVIISMLYYYIIKKYKDYKTSHLVKN